MGKPTPGCQRNAELSLEEMRRRYRHGGLSKSDLDACPFEQFNRWFEESRQADLPAWWEPNAMSISTCDLQGRVTSRTLLLKGCDQRGFRFYTNYESGKGKQLAENPQAAMLFYWPFLERQVRIQGRVEKVDRGDSEAYFRSRPRGSQIGAAVSNQSRPIASRAELEDVFAQYEATLDDAPVALPETWGGYQLVPDRFEFWQGRDNRLHDRLGYRLDAGKWTMERLQP